MKRSHLVAIFIISLALFSSMVGCTPVSAQTKKSKAKSPETVKRVQQIAPVSSTVKQKKQYQLYLIIDSAQYAAVQGQLDTINAIMDDSNGPHRIIQRFKTIVSGLQSLYAQEKLAQDQPPPAPTKPAEVKSQTTVKKP